MTPRILIGYSACPLTLEAFERAGCEAWTCDLLPSRGRTDRHIQGDVWGVLGERWDMAVLHPMCTYLTISAAWAFTDGPYHQHVKPDTLVGAARREAREEAIENFKRLDALPFPTAIENPAPSFISKAHRPPDQTIQPYQFGDDASKRTGLWLRGLPRLRPTAWVAGRVVNGKERWSNQTDGGQNKLPPSADRWLERSATFPGIAAAMGAQWGNYLKDKAA